jgi:hypothetical protein
MRTLYAPHKIIVVSLITAILSITFATTATAVRDFPEDHMGIPVLIDYGNDKTGSGFYLNTEEFMYFVTARHVLFNDETCSDFQETTHVSDLPLPQNIAYRFSEKTGKNSIEKILCFNGEMTHEEMQLISNATPTNSNFRQAIEKIYKTQKIQPKYNSATLLSYPKKYNDGDCDNNIYKLQLKLLFDKGAIKYHPSIDVAVIKIGTNKKINGNEIDRELHTSVKDGVLFVSGPGIVSCPVQLVKKFKDVLIGNRVTIFGYPASLSKLSPQLNIKLPLLRNGIVAGKNVVLDNIILDAPMYYGNSGGLVVEVEHQADEKGSTAFRGIGVITELIPYRNSTDDNIQNSGYSIAVPMDYVLDLINDMELKKSIAKPTPVKE